MARSFSRNQLPVRAASSLSSAPIPPPPLFAWYAGEPQTVGKTQDFTGINRLNAEAVELPGWNTIRVELRDGAGKYYLNGKLVNAFEMAFEKDGSPLTRGRIAIQAEGAELTYRNVRVRRLP